MIYCNIWFTCPSKSTGTAIEKIISYIGNRLNFFRIDNSLLKFIHKIKFSFAISSEHRKKTVLFLRYVPLNPAHLDTLLFALLIIKNHYFDWFDSSSELCIIHHVLLVSKQCWVVINIKLSWQISFRWLDLYINWRKVKFSV